VFDISFSSKSRVGSKVTGRFDHGRRIPSRIERGIATAFEITFVGQSVNLAPAVEQRQGDVKLIIITRDMLLPFVRKQLEKTFASLQCYFAVEVLIREVEVEYTGDTEEEEKQILVKGSSAKRKTELSG
jgi:hypothetical protein